MSSASGYREGDGGRLGGARADFVASLGRRVSSARELLAIVEDDPGSMEVRDELRRRIHALASGARLLGFYAINRSLQEVLGVLDRTAQAGDLTEAEVRFAAQTLDDLPALAWDGARAQAAAGRPASDDAPATVPVSVLVVGAEALADSLLEDAVREGRSFECERTTEIAGALRVARALAPDLAVIDVDVPGAVALIETLLDDPLTEPVPIIVVGTFRSSEEAARFVALGVARTLAKPAPAAVLRGACDEILDGREGRTQRMTLGEPTLEQLAERLSQEIERALVGSVDGAARSRRVPLGEGTEVMGALWGAIARVQEIISQKTRGTIRFGATAPEGAIALAPWLHHDTAGADRSTTRPRGSAAPVRMRGRRVVVADDDPGVTWFISDLLRTAGCEVFEALDGIAALELSFRVEPELVVSDILMPGLDGFALSRALRRDVALRDTPVILLSWKEDLLQRVRELGASAAAYMRKETDSRAILARVREVLLPRERIETRLKAEGEMRGRLDGLSPRLLLDLVCTLRKDARLSVRDAAFLYEIDVREGAPRKATRTASDGTYQSGERVLASLLGVGAGRFIVSHVEGSGRGDLSGTLASQLARPIAAARGALAATTGAGTTQVTRVTLDRSGLEEYLRATPDPSRSLIGRLADGASPRRMLLDGEVAPSLLEDVLADLAARGAILGVEGADGSDLLSPAVEAALSAAQERELADSQDPRPGPTSMRPEPRARAAVMREPNDADPLRSPSPPEPSSDDPSAPEVTSEGPPSSLEDAVMREISDRSPFPGSAQPSAPQLPPIVEPSELRPRSSNPPMDEMSGDENAPLPSIPPDAVVPAGLDSEPILETSVSVVDVPASLFQAPDEEPASILDSPPVAIPLVRAHAERRPSVGGLFVAFLLLVVAIVATLYFSKGGAVPWLRPSPTSTP